MDNRMRAQQVVEWEVLCVTDADPQTFATNMKAALQRLTDEGYAIISQMTRGPALIITGQRARPAEGARLGEGTSPVARVGDVVRGVVVSAPRATLGDLQEEVLYYFKEGEEQKHRAFPNMLEALRLLSTHLSLDGILPIRLVATSVTCFDPPAFKELLKLFAEELREDRPHQPE